MKNFLIGLISGVLLAGLTTVILLFVLVRVAASFGERTPKVADGSTLIFKMEGAVPEKSATEIPLPFLDDQAPLSVIQVWQTFRKAAADPKVKAIVFEPRGLAVGWAQLQEIHEEMMQFRKSGKPLVAYLRSPGTREYYLATACDRIYMVPEDSLDLKGIRVEAMYIKDTLDKVGARMDVVHAGKYKDAGDMFTQDQMSPETREVLNNVLDQLYGDLISTIATGRKKQPDEIKALIDQGPFMAQRALAAGLVDALSYDEQVAWDLTKRLNQGELKRLALKTYVKTSAASIGVEGGKKIALIVGSGEIHRGAGTSAFGDQDGIYSGAFTKLLHEVENDASIKGAILRVDSPGGDGVASDEILHAAKNLSNKKPLVISMGDYAASGGYFISMTGDPIVAYPNTLTGSIGVIFERLNLHGVYDKLGVKKELLTRGRYADLDSDYAQLTEDERAKIRGQIDEFYKVFVSRVADGRKQPFGKMEELAQGRVWMGAQAKKNGLIDELGGLDKALELVKKRANIPAGDRITLVPFPPKRNLFEVIASRSVSDLPELDSKLEARISKLLGIPVGVWKDGGFLKMMPYAISVH